GQESQLSQFLTGADVPDPAACVIRHFNELDRRGRILHAFVCPQEMLPPPPHDTTPIGTGTGGAGGTGRGGAGGTGTPPPRDGGVTGAGGITGGPDGGMLMGAGG